MDQPDPSWSATSGPTPPPPHRAANGPDVPAAGVLIRRVRTARGLTLADLGALCGYSASTVSRLERGVQPLRDIVVLASIADALQIPPQALGLADPGRRHASAAPLRSASVGDGPDRVGARQLVGGEDPVRRRELLAGAAGIAAAAAFSAVPDRAAARPAAGPTLAADLERVLYRGDPAADPVSLPSLHRAVTAARTDFQGARYRQLAGTVPALIATATATRDAADGDRRPAAEALLADAYTTAGNLLVKVNDDLMAMATADRAVQAAEHADDPLALALADARRSVAVVLRRTGRTAAAQDLVIRAAAAIEPTGAAGPEQLSMYGTLLAVAAYTAAVDGDRSSAHDLIDEAATAATRLGHDANHRHTAFGPTNIALYRLSIAQVLGDNGTAVEHARTVRTSAITTPERRGRYWIDLARAYHQWGKYPQCYQALIAAERASPADVRYRPPVHHMVLDLLRADRRRVLPDLPAFATASVLAYDSVSELPSPTWRP